MAKKQKLKARQWLEIYVAGPAELQGSDDIKGKGDMRLPGTPS